MTRERVEATPLRALAEAAEMSPRGLLEYLKGGNSAPSVTATLRRRAAEELGACSPACDSLFEQLRVTAARYCPAATVCVSVLETVISPLAPRVHAPASGDFLDVLIKAHQQADGGTPQWLTSLRAGIDAYLVRTATGDSSPPAPAESPG